MGTMGSISQPNGSKLPQLHHNLDHVANAGSSIVEEGLGSSKKISTEKSSLAEELQDVNVNGLESNNFTINFLPSSEASLKVLILKAMYLVAISLVGLKRTLRT